MRNFVFDLPVLVIATSFFLLLTLRHNVILPTAAAFELNPSLHSQRRQNVVAKTLGNKPPLLSVSSRQRTVLQQGSSSSSTPATTTPETENLMSILLETMESKKTTQPNDVISALRSLETQQRQLAKEDKDNDTALSKELRDSLVGDWQLILVTDKRLQSVIYLPVQNIFSIRQNSKDSSLDDDPFQVENAIRIGQDWTLLSFVGEMEFDLRKRQGLFDYDRFTLFNRAIDIDLKPGQAERMVSTVEKRATSKTKRPLFGAYEKPSSTRPFFNFFLANDQMAAARGSVGGFALWKRVVS